MSLAEEASQKPLYEFMLWEVPIVSDDSSNIVFSGRSGFSKIIYNSNCDLNVKDYNNIITAI